jgi:putative tricarboxylic transport membrane protein
MKNSMSAEPDTTAEPSPPVVGTRSVDMVVSLLLLGVALLLGWDSWRIGMSWADDGPQAGYFPFYLSLLMGAASVYGLVRALMARAAADDAFVLRDQFGRVLQVFVPTLLYCIAMQFLGLYVASFVLIAGFMWWTGGIRVWVSLVTAFVFAATMFITFEIAFDVIMPKGPLEAVFGY